MQITCEKQMWDKTFLHKLYALFTLEQRHRNHKIGLNFFQVEKHIQNFDFLHKQFFLYIYHRNKFHFL